MTSFLDVIALLKSAPHPNAGKLFIEFILSEEGQKVVAAAGYIPARPDVPASTPTLKPDAGNFKALVIPTSVMDRNLNAWVKIYNEKFK
jgi:ABC-type Fe3+ transport system substrate-binding protein